MPIYGKLLNFRIWNQTADDLETWYAHWVFEYYLDCSVDDPGLTLTYFTARSNLVSIVFVWENIISKTSVVYDIQETIEPVKWKLVCIVK